MRTRVALSPCESTRTSPAACHRMKPAAMRSYASATRRQRGSASSPPMQCWNRNRSGPNLRYAWRQTHQVARLHNHPSRSRSPSASASTPRASAAWMPWCSHPLRCLLWIAWSRLHEQQNRGNYAAVERCAPTYEKCAAAFEEFGAYQRATVSLTGAGDARMYK